MRLAFEVKSIEFDEQLHEEYEVEDRVNDNNKLS